MEDVDPSAGGTPEGSSGAQDKNQDIEKKSGSKDVVSYDSHQKLLSEKKRIQARLDELEKEKKHREETSLKEQNKWKEIAEQREKESLEVKSKLAQREQIINDARKRSAVLEHISGNVEKQYWALLDLDDVEINEETGEIDEASAQKAAKAFEASYGKVIDKPDATRMPNDAAKGGGVKLSYDKWLTLPLKEKKERYHEVFDANKTA